MKPALGSILGIFRQLLLRGLVLGLLCAFAPWQLTHTAVLRGLNDLLLDGLFSSRGSRPTIARVVLIGLDEKSLDQMHKPLVDISPDLVEIVTYAKSRGAGAIGLDLMVPESLTAMPELDVQPCLARSATCTHGRPVRLRLDEGNGPPVGYGRIMQRDSGVTKNGSSEPVREA